MYEVLHLTYQVKDIDIIYVHFIDAYYRYTWIYLIILKPQVKDMFIIFQKHVELAFDRKIKCVQSD